MPSRKQKQRRTQTLKNKGKTEVDKIKKETINISSKVIREISSKKSQLQDGEKLHAFAAYIAILLTQRQYQSESVTITKKSIGEVLCCSERGGKTGSITQTFQAIDILSNKNIINAKKLNSRKYQIDNINKYDKDYYMAICLDEFDNIINNKSVMLNCRINMLKIFCIMIQTLKTVKSSGITYPLVGKKPMAYMAAQAGLSTTTIDKNIRKLEDLRIVYVHRYNSYTVVNDKQTITLNNLYGRFKNKKFIIEYAEKIKPKDAKEFNVKTKERKSITMRYINLSRKNECNRQDITTLITDMEQYNQYVLGIEKNIRNTKQLDYWDTRLFDIDQCKQQLSKLAIIDT